MEEKKTKEEKKQTHPDALLPEVRANMLLNETSIFFNVALYEQVQRVASMFAGSTMIPEQFRGNIGNCMIALNYAHRLKADEFMVFQNLYEVYGRPGIQGKLVEAVINTSGKYSEPLEYEWLDPEDKPVERREVLKAAVPSEYGCQAFTVDTKSGKTVTGPKITWKLIKENGWYDKKGPDKTMESNKWRTMPEMMFYYRCASWFGNKNCPELTLGMATVEELEDIVELTPGKNGAYSVTDALNAKLQADKTRSTGDIYKAEERTATEKPEGEKEGEKEDQIRKLYKGLGDPKFQEFINSHASAIPNMPKLYRDEIEASWIIRAKKKGGLLEGKPYPLDVAKEEAQAPDDNSEINGGPEVEKKPNLVSLNCPRTYDEVPQKNLEGKVLETVCEKCEFRENESGEIICAVYEKYQENSKT